MRVQWKKGTEVMGAAVGNTMCLRPATGGIPVGPYNALVNLKLDLRSRSLLNTYMGAAAATSIRLG